MKRIVAAVFLTVVLTGVSGCTDSTSGPEIDAHLPPGIAVSNPVLTRGFNASAAPSAAAGEGVAYISASPGTFPDASTGTLSNESQGGSPLQINIAQGGFDPVAVIARAGDEIRLDLTTLSGAALPPLSIKVPPRKPPTVVRTNPAKGRTDVALNVQVEVVFSEPVNRSTITSSNLSLVVGTSPVAAMLELSPDGLIARVVPEISLVPGETYSLMSNGIQDLDGDVLAEATITTFATAPASAGGGVPASKTIASIVPLPFSPVAINDDGIVVGTSSGGAMLLWRNSPITTLELTPLFFSPMALNNSLVVAGVGAVQDVFNGKEFTSTHAIQWKGGSFTDLGTLPGHNYSEVKAINDAGDIVGISGIWDGDPDGCCSDMRAVMWHNAQISELPFIWPYSINSSGEILAGRFVNGNWKLLIWHDGIVTDLTGGCFDLPVGLSSARMNNRGQIAATCMNKPFIWQNGDVVLLPIPSGCSEGMSSDIDDLGRVVGYVLCRDAPTVRPVIWIDGSVFPLPPGGDGLPQKLNNRGEILGRVGNNPVMWVLNPTR